MNESDVNAVVSTPEKPKAPPPPPPPRNRHERRAATKKGRVLAQKKAAARKKQGWTAHPITDLTHYPGTPNIHLGEGDYENGYERLSDATKVRIAKGVKIIDAVKNLTLSLVPLPPGEQNRIVLRKTDPKSEGDGT